jgi:hypothetical protein
MVVADFVLSVYLANNRSSKNFDLVEGMILLHSAIIDHKSA